MKISKGSMYLNISDKKLRTYRSGKWLTLSEWVELVESKGLDRL